MIWIWISIHLKMYFCAKCVLRRQNKHIIHMYCLQFQMEYRAQNYISLNVGPSKQNVVVPIWRCFNICLFPTMQTRFRAVSHCRAGSDMVAWGAVSFLKQHISLNSRLNLYFFDCKDFCIHIFSNNIILLICISFCKFSFEFCISFCIYFQTYHI